MVKSVCGAAFALVLTGQVQAGDTVTWQENIQGWTVVVDRTIEDSCFIVSGFENEMLLRFQFNATQKNVQFIVASTDWASLKNGEEYDLEVAFGDQDPWTGLAKGHRWNDILPSLILSVPVEARQASSFVREFTAMETVRISHAGTEIAHLALTGADEAVNAMLACQASMAHAAENAGEDPFAPQDAPI